ncbi:uncharacterized protein LOC106158203 [Lingula anatina]|uniref:Uncharacterized protein LOC106158203 n=1 Tax=Lingula anatina TaxID=7574 RepID=A0A1S3HWX1_LINAN|nr:uncharacterized protein LOC106158203 [Lingula anatina]|eukprot:XP_013389559.1 uncharacterized protein LOC106158203 [Lingula anatina]
MRYCNVLALAFIVLFGIKADAKVPPECLCSLHGILGGTMYTSCDEAHITFSGSCTYSLMKTCNDTSDDMIYKPPFKVEVKNDYKTENDNQNTFVREISVSFRDNSITFDSKGGFMVNNNQAATDYIGDGFTVTRLELAEFDVIELNTDFSLKILIHTNSPTHRIRVKVGR